MPTRRPEPIEIPGLDIPKAKRYSRTRLAVLLLSTLWSVARLVWFASDHRAARLRSSVAAAAPNPRLTTPVFVAIATLLSWVSGLPAAFVGGYAVERRFGLTRQPVRGWFADQA